MKRCPECNGYDEPGLHGGACGRDDLDALGVPMELRGIVCERHEHCEVCRNAAELRADDAGAPDGWSSMPTEKVYGQPCPRCGNTDPQGTHRFIGPRKRVVFFVADEEALPPAGRFRFWMSKNAEKHLTEKAEAAKQLAARVKDAKQRDAAVREKKKRTTRAA